MRLLRMITEKPISKPINNSEEELIREEHVQNLTYPKY